MLCEVGSDRIMRDMSWDVSRHLRGGGRVGRS
jgi:hypothetical protein